MLLLAVKTIQVGLALASQTGQLPPTDQKAWEQVASSVVTVQRSGRPFNVAVCISSQGLFLSYSPGIKGALQARMNDGRAITLVPVSTDSRSRLALYQASPWLPDFAKPVQLSAGDPAPGTKLLAAMTTGVAKVMVSSSNGFGFFGKDPRPMPLYDVRFEGESPQVAGALLFTYRGELVSIACAVLGSSPQIKTGPGFTTDPQRNFGQQAQGGGSLNGGGQTNNMGPSQLTVAYTPSLSAMRRVVDGFLAPTHQVVYPAIGIYCIDDPLGGAQIRQLVSGGPAFLAGIGLGDVIVSMNGAPIKDQVAFAKVIFGLKIGEKLKLEIRRAGQLISKEVLVGKQSG